MAVPAEVAVPLLMWLRLLLSSVHEWITWRVVIVCVAVAIAKHLWSRHCPRLRPNLPPGPPALPLVGNLLALSAAKHKAPLYIMFENWSRQYGPVITVYSAGNRPTVVVNTGTAMLKMMGTANDGMDFQKRFQTSWKFDCERREDPQTCRGLHDVTAGFVQETLQNGRFEECVTSALDSVIARVRNKHGQPFDPQPLMAYLSFDVIRAVCFTRRLQPEDIEYQKLLRTHLRLNDVFTELHMENTTLRAIFQPPKNKTEFATLQKDLLRPFMMTQLQNRTTTSSCNVLGASHDLAGYILQTRAQPNGGKNKSATTESASQRYNDEETSTANYLCNVFRVNLDMVRLTLAWTLLYLCHRPDVQQSCQKEIDFFLDGHAPGIEDCDMMPYTEAVLYEVMRLRPCKPLGTPGYAACDTSIGGYDIDEGTPVMVNHWSINMDHNTWTDPELFQPERFLNRGRTSVTRPDSWSPFFSGGPPSLGEEVCRLELLLVVSSLLHNFTFAFPEDHQANLEPTGGPFWSAPKPFQVICTARERRHVHLAWQGVTLKRGHADAHTSLGFSSYPDIDELRQSTLRFLEGCSEIPCQCVK